MPWHWSERAVAAQSLVPLHPQFEAAGFGDLAIGRDGTIHVLWQDQSPGSSEQPVFYATSRDGVNWTNPLSLGGAVAGQAGVARLMIDGSGRIYAFWKVPSTAATIGAGMNAATLFGANGGMLQYRVLSDGTWSEIVPVGRGDHIFGWFPAVDVNGHMHLVWSQSEGSGLGPTPWVSTATAVWRARLRGTEGTQELVLREPLIGFHGLHGFIDSQGTVRFVAFGGDRLLLWDGQELSTLRTAVSGSDLKDAAWLLQNGSDQPQLIYYDHASRSVAHWSFDQGSPASAIYSRPTGRIESFQAWQGSSGELLVTVQAKDEGIDGADLEVVRFRNGYWEAPVNLTGNRSRDTAAGVYGVGTAAFSASSWSAAFASAAVNPAGGIDLFLVNRRAASSEGDMGLLGGASAMSVPQAYFTRLGESLQDSGAAPADTVVAGRGVKADQAQPDRQKPGAGELPIGRYDCHHLSTYAGPIENGNAVMILEGGHYRSFDGDGGRYTFDATSRRVGWTSGPFATGNFLAEFTDREDGKPELKVTPLGGGSNGGETNHCVMH